MLDPADVGAVLFDADGTLVDSDAAVERAWTVWAGEHGIQPAVVLEICHGSPAELTVRRLVPHLDEDGVVASAARQLALQYDDLADVGPMPGVERLMAVLRRRQLPWAVVTSGDRRLATARLTAAAIDASVLVTVDEVVDGKPDPEGYLLAARLLGVAPSRCVVVEDSEPGLIAGRAAGAMTVALKGLDGDLAVADLADLAEWLDV